ncbi:MAG TPA: nicotinamide-nucleotide amidohydrolase family protein [Planctomycetota bacterium]|nr:nicotinamide-nucleotide amidohydrolase family protein [Planctomycetota bacterium]
MADSAPTAVILCIGDEVLRGEVVNTNAAWLGQELTALGFRVTEHGVVGDNEDAIVAALDQAVGSAPLVIATGGLGPTGDDLTADAAARFLGVVLAEAPEVLEAIAKRQGKTVAELSPGGRRMARVPAGAEALPNPAGAAPGIHISCGLRIAGCGSGPQPPHNPQPSIHNRHVFLLPGVPHEMKAIFAESIRPIVDKAFPGHVRRCERYWHVASWPESDADAEARRALAGLLAPEGPLEFGDLLGRGWVTLRAVGEGPEAEGHLAEADRRIRGSFGDSLFGTGRDDTIEAVAGRELIERGIRVAMAESCTGGLVSARLVSVPGISASFVEGLVTYGNEAKMRLLGVPALVIMNRGAVSPECAGAMATGLRERSGADITLSVTGIAGPDGGTAAKPVGTVHFGLATERGVEVDSRRFGGSRDWFRERAAAHGLWMLWRAARAAGR